MKRLMVNVFLGTILTMFAATASFAVEQGTSVAPEPAKAGAKQAKKKASSTKGALLDINTATAEQLKSLPGITDKDAGKIIAGRPYTRKNQLKQKDIITSASYESIKAMIVAKKAVK